MSVRSKASAGTQKQASKSRPPRTVKRRPKVIDLASGGLDEADEAKVKVLGAKVPLSVFEDCQAEWLRNGESMADWVRDRLVPDRTNVVGIAPKQPKRETKLADPELKRQLRRLGNNVNQAIRRINIALAADAAAGIELSIFRLEEVQRALQALVEMKVLLHRMDMRAGL